MLKYKIYYSAVVESNDELEAEAFIAYNKDLLQHEETMPLQGESFKSEDFLVLLDVLKLRDTDLRDIELKGLLLLFHSEDCYIIKANSIEHSTYSWILELKTREIRKFLVIDIPTVNFVSTVAGGLIGAEIGGKK